jgi:hypothetical protein
LRFELWWAVVALPLHVDKEHATEHADLAAVTFAHFHELVDTAECRDLTLNLQS